MAARNAPALLEPGEAITHLEPPIQAMRSATPEALCAWSGFAAESAPESYRLRDMAISRNRKVPSVVRGRQDLDQETHDKVQNLLKIQSQTFLNERKQRLPSAPRPRSSAALRPTPAQRGLLPQTSEDRLDEEDQQVILGDETVNPAAEELLVRVFASWCSFGDRLNTTMLSAAKWEKLLEECGLRPASQRSALRRGTAQPGYGALQAAEAGVIWCKVSAALGQPRLRFSGFLKALRIVARRVAPGESFDEFAMAVFGPRAESQHLHAPDEDPCGPGAVDDEHVHDFLATRMEACGILHLYFTPRAFVAGSRSTKEPSRMRQSSVDSARDRASTVSKPGSTVSTTAASDAWAPKGVGTPSPSVMSQGSRGRSSSARRRPLGLPLDAFQAFVRLTAPADLFTAGQVRAIFQASLEERGDGVERWGGCETIGVHAFPNALARLALVAYSVSPYAEMWPTPREKVETYFERILKVTPSNDVGCLRAQGVFSQAESRHDLPRSYVPPHRGRPQSFELQQRPVCALFDSLGMSGGAGASGAGASGAKLEREATRPDELPDTY